MNYNAANVTQLISAILNINDVQPNDATLHTITLTGTTYNLTAAHPRGNLFGASGLPIILKNVKILGNGKTISRFAAAQFRIFAVSLKQTLPNGQLSQFARLTLENLTVQSGDTGATGSGGAILSDAPWLSIIALWITIAPAVGELFGWEQLRL
jgi:hypothetical protein